MAVSVGRINRVPKNSIGAQFKVKLADDSPLSTYVNRDKESFNRVMSPPEKVNPFER